MKFDEPEDQILEVPDSADDQIESQQDFSTEIDSVETVEPALSPFSPLTNDLY